MERRNTIQRDMVLQAVKDMRGHVTADEVYARVVERHPSIGKGTVYRNLNILAEEGEIRKVEISDGPDRFDFTIEEHYHVECVKCHKVYDVDMEPLPDLRQLIRDTHGTEFLSYDVLFKGICPDCKKREGGIEIG